MRSIILRMFVVFAFGMLGIVPNLMAQGSYASAMDQLAQGIHNSLSGTENKTVLVNFFRRTEGKGCNLDETITGDFEVAFGKLPRTFKVLNRAVLHEYAKEHKLQMEGQIDEEQRVKEAGKLLKADIIIFGDYRFVGSSLVLRLHADDIQTSEQLSILRITCTPDRLLKKMCEEASTAPYRNVSTPSTGAPGTRSDQGRIISTEPSNSSPAAPCGSQTGSYCFTNNSKKDLRVYSQIPDERGWKAPWCCELLIRPGGTECYYDKPAGSTVYTLTEIVAPSGAYGHTGKKQVGQGTLRIVPCVTGQMSYP